MPCMSPGLTEKVEPHTKLKSDSAGTSTNAASAPRVNSMPQACPKRSPSNRSTPDASRRLRPSGRLRSASQRAGLAASGAAALPRAVLASMIAENTLIRHCRSTNTPSSTSTFTSPRLLPSRKPAMAKNPSSVASK